ncbi:ABC transporter ATP-binding protein [Youngiibacter fragilis]|uniref:Macrolide ABC transporter ATP-binding protein n=1 Tax=Youngiibacter fragilis 232.1 TaxID=994573 RepID=V7I1M0_9CLOT|nr:ABC transporter ATP-binding protein [Youngiibacter fragilis]ETA79768.1 macrolide ABC transporter ATP-binding protein [Youngiibacter fragilis 232.1]
MIEIRDVVKIYETGAISFKALDGVNLAIGEGEFTGILGPSGSGKSTMMNILGCLDTMTSGSYILDGKEVGSLTDNERAAIRNRKIGFVFQSFNLLPRLTVYENVELPMIYAGMGRHERSERTKKALSKVGLLEWSMHKPNEISGGQKQRVAIARAIAMEPAVIMADEPTGNLDTKSSLDVLRIFQDLNDEGATIIMVTHEPENIKYLKRIVKFKDGKVVEDTEVCNRRVLKDIPPEEYPTTP